MRGVQKPSAASADSSSPQRPRQLWARPNCARELTGSTLRISWNTRSAP
jgi:hypothetical protein